MRRFALIACGVAMMGAGVSARAFAAADERTADAIVKEIDAIEMPTLKGADPKDQAAIRAYFSKRTEAMKKKAELIGELLQVDLADPRLAELLSMRWQTLIGQDSSGVAQVARETDKVNAHTNSGGLKRDAAYWRMVAAVRSGASPDEVAKLIDRYLEVVPRDRNDATAPRQLMSMSVGLEGKAKRRLLETIIERYPDNPATARARAILRQFDAVGKPFDLEFTDAVTGSNVSIKGLKGKVVVIDFWATWCGPCVAELPTMKKLYAEYRDKGVEFIGVSLDEKDGGLDKLKTFVKEKEIGWPQYFQGDGWQSKFSSSWGINAIPCVFVVDQEGKLASVDARGKLDTLIPRLLGKAAASGGE